ncbi:PilW family protein [Thalassotalea aquiviva]|uniref:PilW family protein n=1 Tax=Thalassotalea aquiviva TaxID=3242415 RepID=UPI00352A9693
MKSRAQSGFTLIEFMITLAIALFLLAGVLSVFVGMKSTTDDSTRFGELQENGRFAVSLLTEELLRTGFWGDFPSDLNADNLSSTPAPIAPASDCIGEGANNATFPTSVGHYRTLWGATLTSNTAMGCIDDAKINSDLIQIKRVIAAPIAQADLKSDRFYLYANFNSAEILTATQAPTLTISNPRYWEFQHHIYYVSQEQVNGENIPVLMQSQLTNTSTPMTMTPIVDGIEMIRFMYGVDTTGDGMVNGYYSASSMTDNIWDHTGYNRILAVKMYVLVRDLYPDNSYENTNTYVLGDRHVSFVDNTGKGDKYRRLLLSSTINLYNSREESWP